MILLYFHSCLFLIPILWPVASQFCADTVFSSFVLFVFLQFFGMFLLFLFSKRILYLLDDLVFQGLLALNFLFRVLVMFPVDEMFCYWFLRFIRLF